MNNIDSEIQTLDEKRQMRNLANAISLADSFSLLFVRCNQRPRQKEIIEELVKQLTDYKIKVILLENQVEHLLDELQKRLGDEKPDAIFVYGLESSFPKADESADSKFVVTLNHSRNSFKKVLDCPLVLFLPEYALSAIYHGATDFYSIRSGIYLFSARAEETELKISQYASQGYIELEGLLFEERQNRIKTIEELLAEYQSLPDLQRNFEKEFNLKRKLANLYKISNENAKAENLYKKVIAFARKSKTLVLLSNSLAELASLYHDQKKNKEALKLLNEALEIDKKTVGVEHIDYGATLNGLGGIYIQLGEYDKAKELLNQALKIVEKSIDTHPFEYVMALNNLAVIYKTIGNYVEAIRLNEAALEIDKKIENTEHPSHALRLINLSKFYYDEQKYNKALNLAKEAHKIFSKTLGVNHPDTQDAKNIVNLSQTKKKEQVGLLVPYKN